MSSMKKAFEQNVSRAKPRVRLGGFAAAEGTAEVARAAVDVEAIAAQVANEHDGSVIPSLADTVKARAGAATAPKTTAAQALAQALGDVPPPRSRTVDAPRAPSPAAVLAQAPVAKAEVRYASTWVELAPSEAARTQTFEEVAPAGAGSEGRAGTDLEVARATHALANEGAQRAEAARSAQALANEAAQNAEASRSAQALANESAQRAEAARIANEAAQRAGAARIANEAAQRAESVAVLQAQAETAAARLAQATAQAQADAAAARLAFLEQAAAAVTPATFAAPAQVASARFGSFEPTEVPWVAASPVAITRSGVHSAAQAPEQVTEVQTAPPARPEGADADIRRSKLKERLKAVRENPRPEPLPETVAEAGVLAVERISGLQTELVKVRALNLALSQDLEATRRQAERATEEARLRMDEARRLSLEMDGRVKLLTELEKELSSLEGERNEALLSLQESRQACDAHEVEKDGLRSEIVKREQALAESLSEEERLASELEASHEASANLRRACDALRTERDTLARQVNDLTQERAELLEARKALEAVHRALATAVSR